MPRKSTWTKEQDELIMSLYQNGSWEELEAKLGRKRGSIASRASRLGVSRVKVRNSLYTKEEIDLISREYCDIGAEGIHRHYLPHRSVGSIACLATRLGIAKSRSWTEEEIDILKTYYPILSIDEVSDMLPRRSRDAVVLIAKKYKLRSKNNNRYTDEQVEFIKDNYLLMSDEEIGAAIGKDRAAVKDKRRRMKLQRPTRRASVGYESLDALMRKYNLDWKKESLARCGYKCVVTGGRIGAIHHLYGLNLIIRDMTRRLHIDMDTFDINKCSLDYRAELVAEFRKEQSKHPFGVCLSDSVHKDFHAKYGYGYNTEDQFIEYLNTLGEDRLDLSFLYA